MFTFNVLTRINPLHLQSHYPHSHIECHILTPDTAHISALQKCLQAAAVVDHACSLAGTGE